MNSTISTKLTKEQKTAVGLLSIGTFLEYFDLMLYVHMAVLLNELFFPKSDLHTGKLLSAFAFSSVFVVRPLGAIIFGWIGDTIGRKSTVIITTILMSFSCIVMANLPTYAQIGITASYLITLCRILQGISSMGEIVGAEIYLTEITKPPAQYPAVMLVAVCSILGGTAALGVASIVTSHGLNWRIAFWLGAGTAIIGTVARKALRESAEFADAKSQLEKTFENTSFNKKELTKSSIWNAKINIKTIMSLFFIQCGWPVCFYFVYMYCGDVMKDRFHYTSVQVIHQNFIVSMVNLFGYIVLTYLSYKVNPLKILKIKALAVFPAILVCPYIMTHMTDPIQLLLIQSFFILFVLSTNPATPILYKHIPVFKRFRAGSFVYALSRAFMHLITSFGLLYLSDYFGRYGILFIMVPVCIGYGLGVLHFDNLEKQEEYK
jgi:MFS family permease